MLHVKFILIFFISSFFLKVLLFFLLLLCPVVEGRNLKYKGKLLSSATTYAVVDPPRDAESPGLKSLAREQITTSCQKGASPRWDHTFVVYVELCYFFD